jgi:hypothetical protein
MAPLTACGGSESTDGAGGGGSSGNNTSTSSGGSNGTTPCGAVDGSPKQCIAGQYCKDETLSICDNGCLSNSNCASDQQCMKDSGANVGSCQGTATKDCATFITKCQACQGGSSCTQAFCDAASAECITCVNNSNCGQGCDSACGAP